MPDPTPTKQSFADYQNNITRDYTPGATYGQLILNDPTKGKINLSDYGISNLDSVTLQKIAGIGGYKVTTDANGRIIEDTGQGGGTVPDASTPVGNAGLARVTPPSSSGPAGAGYRDDATGAMVYPGQPGFDASKLSGSPSNPAADYLAGGSFTPPPTEDQNYKTLLDRASGLITNTNKSFQDEIDAKNAASAARVNAGGLAGSSAGGTITEEAIAPIVDARNTAISKIYSDIETNAENLTLQEKQLADTEATAAVAEQRQQKADALASATKSIGALAANHLDWNKYKTENPDNYNALVQAVGGDPNVADAMFAMSIPAPEIVSSWTTGDGNGGTTVWQQRTDPITKQPSIVKYDMPGVPIPGNWTSDKLGTNSQIFKSPDFNNNPTDPKNFMIVSSDPTNGGAITVTKDGVTTVNGIVVDQKSTQEAQNYATGILDGNITSIASVPKQYRDAVATILAGGGSNTDASKIIQDTATFSGISDPTQPLSDSIANTNVGVEGIVAGIIKQEGGSPKGVINNPGNIKFTGAPGQIDSGVQAADGGTFASYSTIQDGKGAIGALVQNAADKGQTFQDFVASYKGLNTSGDASQYSPLAASRFTMASNRIVSNYIQLPAYQLTAGGQIYLGRIAAAMKTPGSISDQDLLDSLTKLNTGGNAISDAQVSLITNGKSFADTANVLGNKLKNGGVLSDSQRQQLSKIASAIFESYKKQYQPIYDQASKQLKEAGIPKAFWTIPDLNTLSAQGGIGDNSSSNTDSSDTSGDSSSSQFDNLFSTYGGQ